MIAMFHRMVMYGLVTLPLVAIADTLLLVQMMGMSEQLGEQDFLIRKITPRRLGVYIKDKKTREMSEHGLDTYTNIVNKLVFCLNKTCQLLLSRLD